MLKKILVAIDDGETDGHILCEAISLASNRCSTNTYPHNTPLS